MLAEEVQKVKALSLRLFSRGSGPVERFADDLESIARRNVAVMEERKASKAVIPVQSRVSSTIRAGAEKLSIEISARTILDPADINSKKRSTAGPYYEIHGPGGRVKITTNVAVMQKAKKQGIHVQTKYKMPTGKKPVTIGFYDIKSDSPADRAALQLAVLNPESARFQRAVENYGKALRNDIANLFGTAI
jgi:hypothetical protein